MHPDENSTVTPLKAQSGRLVVLSNKDYKALCRKGPPLPDGLCLMLSPLGGFVLIESNSAEYLAGSWIRRRLSDDYLAYVVDISMHPHFVAELLFAFGKIPQFEKMIATQPAVAAHILALDGNAFPDDLARAQQITRIILAKKGALAAIAEIGD